TRSQEVTTIMTNLTSKLICTYAIVSDCGRLGPVSLEGGSMKGGWTAYRSPGAAAIKKYFYGVESSFDNYYFKDIPEGSAERLVYQHRSGGRTVAMEADGCWGQLCWRAAGCVVDGLRIVRLVLVRLKSTSMGWRPVSITTTSKTSPKGLLSAWCTSMVRVCGPWRWMRMRMRRGWILLTRRRVSLGGRCGKIRSGF